MQILSSDYHCSILHYAVTSSLPLQLGSLRVVPMSASFPQPSKKQTCGLGNDCPAASRCEIQTLSHVRDSVNEKILDYLGHFYGQWENHNTIVKFGIARGIQVE